MFGISTPPVEIKERISWFEFLLNPSLLDDYLKLKNPDPTLLDLVSTFLFQATQTNKIDLPANDCEKPKDSKKSKSLKHLALKIIAHYNWNVEFLNKNLPLAMVNDCLLRLTGIAEVRDLLDTNKDVLTSYSGIQAFAAITYHSWVLYTLCNEKLHTKPDRVISVQAPGYVNPKLQSEMAKPTILAMINELEQLSVQILETAISLDLTSLCLPNSKAFVMQSGNVNPDLKADWSESFELNAMDIKAMLGYVLGKYFFFKEDYKKAIEYFTKAFQQIKNIPRSLIDTYDLVGYLVALGLDIENLFPDVESPFSVRTETLFASGPRSSSSDKRGQSTADHDTAATLDYTSAETDFTSDHSGSSSLRSTAPVRKTTAQLISDSVSTTHNGKCETDAKSSPVPVSIETPSSRRGDPLLPTRRSDVSCDSPISGPESPDRKRARIFSTAGGGGSTPGSLKRRLERGADRRRVDAADSDSDDEADNSCGGPTRIKRRRKTKTVINPPAEKLSASTPSWSNMERCKDPNEKSGGSRDTASAGPPHSTAFKIPPGSFDDLCPPLSPHSSSDEEEQVGMEDENGRLQEEEGGGDSSTTSYDYSVIRIAGKPFHLCQLLFENSFDRLHENAENKKLYCQQLRKDNLLREFPLELRQIIEEALFPGPYHKESVIYNTSLMTIEGIPRSNIHSVIAIQNCKEFTTDLLTNFKDLFFDMDLTSQKFTRDYIVYICCMMNRDVVDTILKSRQMYAILSCHSVYQLMTLPREDKKHVSLVDIGEDSPLPPNYKNILHVSYIPDVISKCIEKLASIHTDKEIFEINKEWKISRSLVQLADKISVRIKRLNFVIFYTKAICAMQNKLNIPAQKLFEEALSISKELSSRMAGPLFNAVLKNAIICCNQSDFICTVEPSDIVVQVKNYLVSYANKDAAVDEHVFMLSSSLLANRKEWNYLNNCNIPQKSIMFARFISEVVIDFPNYVKNKPAVRNLWELVVNIFSTKRVIDNSIISQHVFDYYITTINNDVILRLLVSVLTKIYAVLMKDCVSVINEYDLLWPSDINCNVSKKTVLNSLHKILRHTIEIFPSNPHYLMIHASLLYTEEKFLETMTTTLYLASLKTYCFTSVETVPNATVRVLIDCSTRLNRHLHSALLCQYLDTIDYNTAFNSLQEITSNDNVDYSLFFDIDILEFLISLHTKRNENDRKQLAIKMICRPEINIHNPAEILKMAQLSRKTDMLLMLCDLYI